MTSSPGAPPSVWLNGALVRAEEARVSPFDHGLLVGDGVFETLRVYRGVPFAWRRHLERLAHSATGLGLPLPDAQLLRGAVDAVLTANEIAEGRVRITVTGGVSPLGSERAETATTVLVAASELATRPERPEVVIVPWRRNDRGAVTGLKTISYAENVRALAYARARGATEAIFANTRDELCEATGSNVFLVAGGVLRTPPADSGCLLGVTRALVLELCVALDVAFVEATLPITALRDSEEAFLTSTTREVQAISRVDGHALPPAPGPLTRQLAKAFAALVAGDLDP